MVWCERLWCGVGACLFVATVSQQAAPHCTLLAATRYSRPASPMTVTVVGWATHIPSAMVCFCGALLSHAVVIRCCGRQQGTHQQGKKAGWHKPHLLDRARQLTSSSKTVDQYVTNSTKELTKADNAASATACTRLSHTLHLFPAAAAHHTDPHVVPAPRVATCVCCPLLCVGTCRSAARPTTMVAAWTHMQVGWAQNDSSSSSRPGIKHSQCRS